MEAKGKDLAASLDSNCEDELPTPSRLIRRKPDLLCIIELCQFQLIEEMLFMLTNDGLDLPFQVGHIERNIAVIESESFSCHNKLAIA